MFWTSQYIWSSTSDVCTKRIHFDFEATLKSFKYQETIIVKLKMFHIDNLAFYPMLVHPNLMFHNFLKWPITFDTNCRSFAASLHFLLPEFHITSTRSLAPVLHFSTEMAFLWCCWTHRILGLSFRRRLSLKETSIKVGLLDFDLSHLLFCICSICYSVFLFL